MFKALRFPNCLDDISAALHYSAKPEAEYMILDRKARCYLFLKSWLLASKTFKEAVKGIELVEDVNKDPPQSLSFYFCIITLMISVI